MVNVAINGLGRIGRATLKIVLNTPDLELIPVGSIADIVFLTTRRTSVDEINSAFKQEAQTERYSGILGVAEDPIVSSDIIKDPRASVIDLSMTQVVDGDLVKVMSCYDNEWAMPIRWSEKLCELQRPAMTRREKRVDQSTRIKEARQTCSETPMFEPEILRTGT